MVLPRTSFFKSGFRPSTLRTAGARARARYSRPNGKRSYASGASHASPHHPDTTKSSDLPWLIGSIAITVPSATWLWQQGPTKSEHGHGHEEHAEHEASEEKPDEAESTDEGEKEEGGEDKNDKEEESKKDAVDDSKSDEKSDDSGSEDDSKDTPETSDDEGYEKPSADSPGQINENPSKGSGELQKGGRAKTESKGEKDSQGDTSGAQNPYLDDDEKSKKGAGPKETAKIHGTVDSSGPLR